MKKLKSLQITIFLSLYTLHLSLMAEAQRNASHPINDVPRPIPPAARNTPQMSQPLPPHVAHVHPAPRGPAVESQGRNPRQFSYSNHMGHASHETPIRGSGDELIGWKVLIRHYSMQSQS